ncbi:MAG: hypothetical protein QM647_13105 [Asticcacaulis sp.]|uniref:hypothetical protein n=1 Tax=Asticcacaulis sp. TaxID=1872648 RepID=UPI0039E497E5
MPTITITKKVEQEVKFLRVDAGVRYWEDATVNGKEDDESKPTIPFAAGDAWKPLIDIESGKIVDWPEGITASVHYKVCDAGLYALLDADKNVVAEHDGYVPKMLSPKDNGYGDYIIMDIGADGVIADWRIDFDKFEADED